MLGSSLTKEAQDAINNSDVLIGSERLIRYFTDQNHKTYSTNTPDEILDIITITKENSFSILVSGDIGFYSLGSILAPKLIKYDLVLIPGISSVNYFFGKCGLSWENAKLISAHGRKCNIVEAVRRNKLTFVLTANNTSEIAEKLINTGFSDLKVLVGEKLGMLNEKITETTIYKLKKMSTCPLTVLIIQNPDFDVSYRVGIEDSLFIRTDIPMTKAFVRAATMAKLSLSSNSICYDVGCGTGSVTVEMALLAYDGYVYSFDKEQEAVDLTKKNCRHFQIGNSSVLGGLAPKVFDLIPPPDCAFIGGSNGKMKEIVSALYEKNPNVKIVINAVSPQSATSAIYALESIGFEADVSQLSVSTGKKVGGIHMMKAENPIYIISGGVSNRQDTNRRNKQWFR